MRTQIIRYVFYSITVLIAFLATNYLEGLLLAETRRFNPYTAALVGMAMVVAVFVPLFSLIDRGVQTLTSRAAGKARQMFGSNLGLIGFVVAILVILYLLYLYQWYGIRMI